MSIRSTLAHLISPPAPEAATTDKRNEVKTGFFSSKRFLVVIAFGALLVLNMLPAALFHDAALVLIAYLIGESATSVATVVVNGWIKVHEVKLDIAYEELDDQRRAKMNQGVVMTATSGYAQGIPPKA